MRARLAAVVLVALIVAAPRVAGADDPIGIGLFAPSAPFAGTADRLGFVTALAEHVGGELGRTVRGRVYASASALDAALAKGEIDYAIVDAPAVAGRKPLLTLTRGDGGTAPWVLLGGTARELGALAGKRIAIAQTGGRAAGFVAAVLFEGEVAESYFAAVVEAPDAPSALKLVTLGKADAAVVSSAIERGELAVALSLRSIPWPALIAGAQADAQVTTAVVAAARTWGGSGGFTGFVAAVAPPRGGQAKKRPTMLTTPARKLELGAFLGRRSFDTPRGELRRYLTAP